MIQQVAKCGLETGQANALEKLSIYNRGLKRMKVLYCSQGWTLTSPYQPFTDKFLQLDERQKV